MNRGAALAVDISTFSLLVMTIVYIYINKLYVDSWNGLSIECLFDWNVYLKLAIPAVITLLIEWSNFEIGSFAAASIDKLQLGLMGIAQTVLFLSYNVLIILIF
jgi:MATE family multidrug resistance protein